MKILLVGSALEGAIEKHFFKYIQESNVYVSIYDIHGDFIRDYKKSIFFKILFRLKFLFIYHTYNLALKRYIVGFNPSHVMVFKGMEVFPSTLRWIKSRGIKIVNYNPDNPFLFSGIGSGNRNVSNSIKIYHGHFTYDNQVLIRLQRSFGLPSFLLPFGFDFSEDILKQCEVANEVNKACFVGNPDKYRASFINALAEMGLQIDVYGYNWSKWLNHKNINCNSSVQGDEFWKTLYKYRIQLNLMRPHNPNSHNMRTFEVPGIGGIMLAPDTPDHKKYFQENTEIFIYTSVDDCFGKAKYILDLPVTEAAKIRKSVRNKSESAGYSYKCRSLEVIEILKNL